LTQHLSVLSIIIGLTAWHGVNKVLIPAAGDVVVVSAGAGAVGSLVGQLAKIKGAKVIGIAGSEAKCKFMKDEVRVGLVPFVPRCSHFCVVMSARAKRDVQCGFDVAINYKTDDVKQSVSSFAPEGVQHYFDNVGGPVTDAVLQVHPFMLFSILCAFAHFPHLFEDNLILFRCSA
jgi:NADPH-dependent curcumin reductase CurA